MDIYIPPGVSESTRTVVFIHGGAWRNGSKARTMPHCTKLYKEGFVVVGINYRLSGDGIFPAQIFDCKAAIRYLKTNASKYHIDTCNIGVTGTSAGGHLVALLGTSNGEPSLEGLHLGNTGVSSDVHAVADFFGPTDFLQMDLYPSPNCDNPMKHDTVTSPESQLVGCWISTCPSRVAEANPLSYINGNEPPFSIHHGDADCLVPVHQSIILHDSLMAAGQNSSLTIYPNGGHGNFINASVIGSMVSFFKNTLNNDCSQNTGISQLNKKKPSLRIYPNPVKDNFTVQGAENKIYKAQIYNNLGQLVKVVENYTPGYPIDLSDRPSGLYVLSMMSPALNEIPLKILKD